MSWNTPVSSRRRAYGIGARLLLWLGAGICCGLLVFLVGYILFKGIPGLSWAFLTGRDSVLRGTNGILPALLNTLYVILLSLAIVLPLGVGAAVYLTEYAQNRRLAGLIEFAAETLAGIPSILYALAGVIVFCTALGLQKTLLAGSLTLAVMTFPTVLRSTQESLKTVPRAYREGALALGAGPWRAIRTVVLPASLDGIVTGCVLAAGRVVGETAVLMYTAGLSTAMQNFTSLRGLARSSGATLTVAMYVYAKERADFEAAFAAAAVLLLLTALINLAALWTGRRLRR